MSKPTIEFKRVVLSEHVTVPEYKTDGSAAVDLIPLISGPVTIAAGDTVLLGTGFAISINDPNYVALIAPRSSKGHKDGLVLSNTVGVIDSDYQGEIKLSMMNRNFDRDVVINPGDRVAQMMFVPVQQVYFTEVEEFSSATERGEGGYGSTGV